MSLFEPVTDTLIVIRAVDERTGGAVQALLAKQVPPANVVVVSDRPFSKTLYKAFQAGISRQLPWTFCIDADVLPLPNVVNSFRYSVQAIESRSLGIQGLVLDKFFGGIRPAGARIYRTALLQTAISYIPTDNQSKRPETYTIKKMQEAGNGWVQHGILSGLHDFEQYYRDVYRTCFFHAQKHKRHIPLLEKYWERMAESDPDFAVALRGARDGLKEGVVLGLDARNFTGRTDKALSDLNLKEKEPLRMNASELVEYVDRTVWEWQIPPEYNELWQNMNRTHSSTRRVAALAARRIGLARFF